MFKTKKKCGESSDMESYGANCGWFEHIKNICVYRCIYDNRLNDEVPSVDYTAAKRLSKHLESIHCRWLHTSTSVYWKC